MHEELVAARPEHDAAARTSLRELMGHAASAGSLDAVYQSALHCVQDGLGIERASLLLFDADGTMRFVAWSGLSDEYRRAVDGHSPWSPGETDADADPGQRRRAGSVARRLRAGFAARGDSRARVHSAAVRRERCSASSCSTTASRTSSRTSEIATAEQIADYVVFALEHHRIAVALEEQLVSERELRQRAETEAAQRQDSESRLHVALAAGQMGAWELGHRRRGCVRWSEELERMHGLEPDAFERHADEVLQLHPSARRRALYAQMLEHAAVVAQSLITSWSIAIMRADGAMPLARDQGTFLLRRGGQAERRWSACAPTSRKPGGWRRQPAKRIVARTTSSPRSRTSCAIRWRQCAPASP